MKKLNTLFFILLLVVPFVLNGCTPQELANPKVGTVPPPAGGIAHQPSSGAGKE